MLYFGSSYTLREREKRRERRERERRERERMTAEAYTYRQFFLMTLACLDISSKKMCLYRLFIYHFKAHTISNKLV